MKKTFLLYSVYYILCFALSGLFYFFIAPELEITKRSVSLHTYAWMIESFIVWIVALVILLITKRKVLSLSLSLFFYIVFLVSNVIKIRYLATPIYLIDFTQLGDLLKTWEVFKVFLPFLIGTTVFMFFVIFWGYRKEQATKKHSMSTLIVVIGIFSFLAVFHKGIEKSFRSIGVFHKKNANLAYRGLKYGYLTNFIQAGFFVVKQSVPARYGSDEIYRLVKKYQLNVPLNNTIELKADNVIVLLVESFTDPLDFGWQFSKDPIPSFRKSKIAKVMSPVYGGKSINSEFELMTGMSNQFTPIESLPYQEFIDHEVPGMVESFKSDKFTTNTIQVVRFKGFGYGKIYDYLGVDKKISLAGDNIVKKDPTGKFASSEDIANEVINVTKQQESSFVFAFPNSSHSPWFLQDYPNTDILLSNPNANDKRFEDEISAYANAMNHTDDILKRLFAVFKNSDEKTIIIMLGDHQPGMHGYNQKYQVDDRYGEYINHILKNYMVPITVWSNYREIQAQNVLSMNFLPSYILELAGVEIKGFMKFNHIIRNKVEVFSHIIKGKNGLYHQDVPNDLEEIINDYRMLQYDILFGEYHLKNMID